MALMLTFIISGIWHGASLTFVVWGLLQGAFLSIEAIINKSKLTFEKKFRLQTNVFYNSLTIVLTFILFAFSQIFGRATNIDDAFMVIRKMVLEQGNMFIGSPSTLIYGLFGLSIMLINDFIFEFNKTRWKLLCSNQSAFQVLSISLIVIIILLIGVFDGGQFIYFQF